MDFNKFFSAKGGPASGGQSKLFRFPLIAIGAFIILILVFGLGLAVGFKKAGFSYRWGENYHRNFAGPRGGFFQDFAGRDLIESHGVFGQIIKIELPTLIIDGKKDAEKVIVMKGDTIIKRNRETILPADLKVDDQIVIIGSPNESGQIEAKLIRVMPSPPPDFRPSRNIFPNRKIQMNPNATGTN